MLALARHPWGCCAPPVKHEGLLALPCYLFQGPVMETALLAPPASKASAKPMGWRFFSYFCPE